MNWDKNIFMNKNRKKTRTNIRIITRIGIKRE